MSVQMGLGTSLVPNAPRPAGPKHDSLHMAEGLKYCWCNCARCFLRYASGAGICICRTCTCQEYWNSTYPVYVPRADG